MIQSDLENARKMNFKKTRKHIEALEGYCSSTGSETLKAQK